MLLYNIFAKSNKQKKIDFKNWTELKWFQVEINSFQINKAYLHLFTI